MLLSLLKNGHFFSNVTKYIICLVSFIFKENFITTLKATIYSLTNFGSVNEGL